MPERPYNSLLCKRKRKMTDQTAYLNLVLEKLNERIVKLNLSLQEGAKEVEDMHEYYWENYTEMDQYG